LLLFCLFIILFTCYLVVVLLFYLLLSHWYSAHCLNLLLFFVLYCSDSSGSYKSESFKAASPPAV
jgi:hypothetical protein